MELAKPHLRLFRAGLACAAMLLAMSAQGYEARFIDGLSAQEKAATGIAKLTAAQTAALDVLVSHDATLAQQGGVTGFSSGFLARHSDAERSTAGIDRLTDKEKSILDILVARTIALGPPPDQPFTYSPPQAKAAPPPVPPAPSEVAVSAPRHAEVHGDVSFTVGAGGHGSNFYGTSMDINVTDPTGKFTLGVGFDDYHGKGLLPLYGPYGPYGLYGPYSAYGPIGPGYVGPPYWGP